MAKVRLSRVPKNPFKNIQALNRHKKVLLGLPVKVKTKDKLWGYVVNPSDPSEFIPDERLLRLLLKAKEYLVTCSLDEVSRWLSAEAKMPISSEGLRIILKERCPFKEILLEYPDRERAYLDLST